MAHHISAIAVQAQAAQAVIDKDPALAREALGKIEMTASETLVEMRRMVGILRGADHRAPTLASLMSKLSARNRVELAIWAYENGRIAQQ